MVYHFPVCVRNICLSWNSNWVRCHPFLYREISRQDLLSIIDLFLASPVMFITIVPLFSLMPACVICASRLYFAIQETKDPIQKAGNQSFHDGTESVIIFDRMWLKAGDLVFHNSKCCIWFFYCWRVDFNNGIQWANIQTSLAQRTP